MYFYIKKHGRFSVTQNSSNVTREITEVIET
jgi:hypothetical protein